MNLELNLTAAELNQEYSMIDAAGASEEFEQLRKCN